MEQERGMEERPSTPALYEFPALGRLHFFSAQNQGGTADYLAHLRAPTMHPRCKKAPIARSKASPSSGLRRGKPRSIRT
jgi:hypothetical protein